MRNGDPKICPQCQEREKDGGYCRLCKNRKRREYYAHNMRNYPKRTLGRPPDPNSKRQQKIREREEAA